MFPVMSLRDRVSITAGFLLAGADGRGEDAARHAEEFNQDPRAIELLFV